MVQIITSQEARERDRAAQEQYEIPASLLMEDAGVRAADEIERSFPKTETLLVIIGRGNNGGDGVVVARQLFALGKNVHIFSLYPTTAFSPLLAQQYLMAEALHIPIHHLKRGKSHATIVQYAKGPTVLVDAILGTGSHGKLKDPEKTVIGSLNKIRREHPNTTRTVSLDIPSGLDATSGKSMGNAVVADRTITFDLPKRGLFLNAGPKHSGRVIVAHIGIPSVLGVPTRSLRNAELAGNPANAARISRNSKRREKLYRRLEASEQGSRRSEAHLPHPNLREWLTPRRNEEIWITSEMITRLLHEPSPLAHKGNRGKVLIIAGSRGMAGAAILCSRSALRGGAGIVYLAVPPEIQNSVNTANPEVITLNVENIDELRPIISKVDSVAIGPGLGLSEKTRQYLNRLYTEIDKRGTHIRGVVVDADGLFLLDRILRTPRSRKRPWIITPHAGEFSKLTDGSTQTVQKFAKQFQTTLVLKGPHTVISHLGKETFHNSTGNAGMATAGSGDVLTGMIASYIAQKYSPIEATLVGVYLHGLCGDLQKRSGKRIGFTSHDLLDTIPRAMEQQFAF